MKIAWVIDPVCRQVESAREMLEQAYVQRAKDVGARQRIEVVQFSTDTESVGKVVTTRAEELHADMVVSIPLPISYFKFLCAKSETSGTNMHAILPCQCNECLQKCS